MRKILSIALLVAAVSASCVKITEEAPKVEGYTLDSFSAIIDNQPTRTYAVQGADGSVQMLWHAEDQIAVSDLSSVAMYNLEAGADTTDATFSVDNSSSEVHFTVGAPLYAVSPYVGAELSSGNSLKVNIPVKQCHTGKDGDNDSLRNLMLGSTNDGGSTFDFTLAGSLARFSISVAAGETIRSVKMSTESVNIAGAATVDWQSKKLVELSSKSVILSYDNAPKSPYSEGYALIAPVDFSATDSKVYYEVETDKGVYIFCKKPTKNFVAGCIYNFPLDITKFDKVDAYEELADGKYFFEKLFVASLRATDSTISIGWSSSISNRARLATLLPSSSGDYYGDDITQTYKVALYRDAACSNLVVSVNNIVASSLYNANMLPPRFVFPGLAPNTTYYAKVWNITDGTSSRVLEVKTEEPVADCNSIVTRDAKAGDLILYENFDKFIYAGDLSTRAAGVSRTDRGSITDIVPVAGEITLSDTGYYMVGGGTEMGLFNTLKNVLDELRMDKWGWIGGKSGANGGSICARPGYLKIGTSGNRSFVCTPALTAIPAGKAATVKVQFRAAPYGDATRADLNNAAEKNLHIKALSGVVLGSDNLVTYSVEEDVEAITIDGDDNTVWGDYEVILENLPSGGVVAIGGGRSSATASNRFQLDDVRITVLSVGDYVVPDGVREAISGTITYSDGTAAAGISVSDGYAVVQTDVNGKYTISRPHNDAWYIYYSIPADCQVNINGYGQPCFFTKYDKSISTYDFTLTKLAGGKETNFALFCLADPQCHSSRRDTQVKADEYRFNNESVPAIKAHVAEKGVPCYGVTLGDIVYSEGSRNSSGNMSKMRSHMAKDNIGMPIFQTMGNHDYTYFYGSSRPLNADATSSTYNIKAQRAFEECFGPINYSWNRGDAHIICMRNMQWTSNTDASKYTSPAFTDEQVEWLKQDLSFVPKDKLVIFCVHVPILNKTAAVINLLKVYPNCHIMSGHTHYMRNEPTRSGGIYEHVHAAVCGQWWWSNINGDGCPNGYGVYDIVGNTIKNWYYKGVNEGMNDRDYQIRLYRGDLICGGSRIYFNMQHGNDVIIANVFNADNAWSVKLYEDGVYSGDMELIPEKKYSPTSSSYPISTSSPVSVPTDSGQDWWAIGYHIGVRGRSGTSGSYHTNCFHMYKYKLKNPNAKTIEVRATDRFGRTYTATDVLSNTASGSYNSAIYAGVPWIY